MARAIGARPLKNNRVSLRYLIPIFEIAAFTRTRMTHFRDEKAEDDGDRWAFGAPHAAVTRGRLRERFDAVYFPSRKPTMRLLFARRA